MRYRACYCEKCGKTEELNLNAKATCECGGKNWFGWAFEEDGAKGVRLDKPIEELYGKDDE